MRALLPWCLLGSLSLLGACASHVVLRSPPGGPSPQRPAHLCKSGEQSCTTAATIDESDSNMSGTTFLPLPECRYGIARILIQNAHSTPVAHVECAEFSQPLTPGGGLGETAPGGGIDEAAAPGSAP